jgi:hypothetical protein
MIKYENCLNHLRDCQLLKCTLAISSGCFYKYVYLLVAAFGGLVVSVLATGPTVAGSGPAEGGEFLGMMKSQYHALPSEGK